MIVERLVETLIRGGREVDTGNMPARTRRRRSSGICIMWH